MEIAEAEGYIAQSTSVPGVAQRTGATVYYLEFFPRAAAERAGREPVMALMPVPGDVDCVVASELVEAGRAIQRGLVTRERTTLISSTHRDYAIAERSAMGSGTAEAQAFDLARVRPSGCMLFDMEAAAERAQRHQRGAARGAVRQWRAAISKGGIPGRHPQQRACGGYEPARLRGCEPDCPAGAVRAPARPRLPARRCRQCRRGHARQRCRGCSTAFDASRPQCRAWPWRARAGQSTSRIRVTRGCISSAWSGSCRWKTAQPPGPVRCWRAWRGGWRYG